VGAVAAAKASVRGQPGQQSNRRRFRIRHP
jgi:hypothetical protein